MRAAALLVLVASCSRPPVVKVPERAATAGDALLARLPPGAAIVLEVDVARLRANAAVGEVVKALVGPVADPVRPERSATLRQAQGERLIASAEAKDPAAALAAITDAPLAGARALVLAAYDVGTPRATTITVVDGDGAPPQATALAGGVWALAVEGDVARLLAVAGGGPSLAADRPLAALRARAMPAAAEGASVRLTARLDGPARRELAAVLGLGDAPAAISAWLDVADDLALIAWVGGEPRTWGPVLVRLRDRAARVPEVGALGLAPVVAEASVAREPAAARLTLVVPPARLRRAAGRALEHMPNTSKVGSLR